MNQPSITSFSLNFQLNSLSWCNRISHLTIYRCKECILLPFKNNILTLELHSFFFCHHSLFLPATLNNPSEFLDYNPLICIELLLLLCIISRTIFQYFCISVNGKLVNQELIHHLKIKIIQNLEQRSDNR